MAKGKSPDDPEKTAPDKPAEESIAELAATALIVDIALREGSLLARRAAHHKLAGGNFRDIKNASLPRASFTKRIAAATLARLAARSVPGTLLVAGGLIAKALFDRRRSRGKGVEEAPDNSAET